MTETTSRPSGTPRGARLPRGERRAQLLTAATDVFVRNGYHATVMDDIAERAGVSKPVLYQHFPSKLELYLALLETHADQLAHRVRGAIDATPDNRERVHNAIQAYFDFVDGEGQAFRLVFESDLRNQPAVQAIVDQSHTVCVAAVARAVRQDAGLPIEHARLLANGIVGMAEHSARMWLANRNGINKDEAVSLISSLAWKGLAGFPLLNPH